MSKCLTKERPNASRLLVDAAAPRNASLNHLGLFVLHPLTQLLWEQRKLGETRRMPRDPDETGVEGAVVVGRDSNGVPGA